MNVEFDPEHEQMPGEEPIEGQEERLEDISPSLKGNKKPKQPPKAAEKAKDKTKEAGKDLTKKAGEKVGEQVAKKGAKQMALAASRAIASAVSAAISAVAGYVGWPALAGCLAIFLIVAIIFGGLGCISLRGYFAKTLVQEAGKDDPHVKSLLAATEQKSNIFGSDYKLEFSNKRDLEFLKSGKIDKRLAAALDYLVQKHEHIQISHIVSAYEDMKANPESGSFHDLQIAKNISAHQNGGAADIDEIDFVKEKCDCGSQIPVQVAWQIIGENPYGEVPDALDQIKSAEDITLPDVQSALEKLGVTGLDQPDLPEMIAAAQTLKNVQSVFDFTNPNIIAAFETLGVRGLDNENLQKGLKRIQALQSLNELDIRDLSALRNSQVQAVFNEVGVPINDEIIQNVEKFQAVKTLQTITSLADLQKPEVKNALQKLNINPDDPNFQAAFGKISSAGSLILWDGQDPTQGQTDSLSQFGLTADASTEKAWTIYQSAKNLYEGLNGEITSEATLIYNLEKLATDIGNPEAQVAVNKFKSAYKIFNTTPNFSDPTYLSALQEFNISLTDDQKQLIEKYKAGQDILDYHGDYTSPEFLANLNKVGISFNNDMVTRYQAAQVLGQAASGKLPKDSQEVKNALGVFKASSIDDPTAQAAVKVGQSNDFNSPYILQEKQTIGLGQADWQAELGKFQSVKYLLDPDNFTEANKATIQQSLANLNIDSAQMETANKIIAANSLLNIHSLSDLQKEGIQNSLKELGLNDAKLYSTLGKLGSLQTLLNIKDVKDLSLEDVRMSLTNLNIKDPQVIEKIGKIGEFYTLAGIRNPADLILPETTDALDDLNIEIPGQVEQLKAAGSVYSLMQIREPKDLLKPENLKALDQLGLIKLDAQLLGQIGAIQNLLQVDSFQDLMNPSSILALNTLNIISLSNPITTGLMALSVVDNLLGGKLLGGMFGTDCEATTACYKPTAQNNIHKAIGELLQFPYDHGDPDNYRITQLITYSTERDVTAFSAQLDKLYGADRPANYGLFSMPEASTHIHIGY